MRKITHFYSFCGADFRLLKRRAVSDKEYPKYYLTYYSRCGKIFITNAVFLCVYAFENGIIQREMHNFKIVQYGTI